MCRHHHSSQPHDPSCRSSFTCPLVLMLLGTLSLSIAYWASNALSVPIFGLTMAMGVFLWWVAVDVLRRRMAS